MLFALVFELLSMYNKPSLKRLRSDWPSGGKTVFEACPHIISLTNGKLLSHFLRERDPVFTPCLITLVKQALEHGTV